MEALKVIIPVSGAFSTGSTWTATVPQITSYVTDTVIMLILNQNNAGTILLKIGALASVELVKLNAAGTASVSLLANDLVKNHPYFFKYESAITGGAWVWVSPTSADQINIAGTSGNVVTVSSGNVLSGSTTPNGFISATVHDNTLAPFKSPTIATTDEFPIVNTTSSNVLGKVTWTTILNNISTSLGALIVAGSSKTPVGTDILGFADGGDSSTKKATFTTLFSINGILMAASTAKTALAAAADLIMIADSGNSNATRKMTLSDVFSVISNLTTKTAIVNADIIPIADSAAATAFNSAKITVANFVASLKTLIATDTLAAPTNITTNNVTSSAHGFAPVAPANAATFLNGAATPAYAAVKDSDLSTSDITTNNASTSKHGFAPKQLSAAQVYLSPWVTVQKTADETISSSVVLQADDALLFSMAASTKYSIRGRFFFDTGATEDFKFRFANTGTAAITRSVINYIVPGTTTIVTAVETSFPTTTTSVVGTGTTNGYVDFMFIVQNTSAGAFRLDWAQNTSGATNTTVLAGSYLEYQVT